MAYTKTTWVDDVTPVSAQKMNNLETQYEKAKADLDTHKADYAAHNWRKIETYTSPGVYNWEAPDLNNGQPYTIGVYLIGGGGSGGAVKYYASSSRYMNASGGASGFARAMVKTVEPFTTYPIVIGTGGAPVVAVSQESVEGNNGNSSSFDGVTVNGGEGGFTGNSTYRDYAVARGADGGVGSDAIRDSEQYSIAPYAGRAPLLSVIGGAYTRGGVSHPLLGFNPFDYSYYLYAGGGASGYYSSARHAQETISIDNNGYKGGKGTAVCANNQNAKGGDATGYGNGGGGVTLTYNESIPAGYTATSGAGTGGAAFIYIGGFKDDDTQHKPQIGISTLFQMCEVGYGGTIYAIAADDNYVYVGGSTAQTVKKLNKSNLSQVAESANYGGTICAIAADDNYVYVGGETTRTAKKLNKSNLSQVVESAYYGGTIYAIAADDNYVYVGGESARTVKKLVHIILIGYKEVT